MMIGLAAEHGEEKTVMIDAISLKAHRTPTSLASKKGVRALLSCLPRVDWPLWDRGRDADWFGEAFQDKGIRACQWFP